MDTERQLQIFEPRESRLKRLYIPIDDPRRRFGNTVVKRGVELTDETLIGMDIKGENIVHPVGYFHR